MTPEAKVKKEVKEWMEAAGCVVSTPIGSSYGTSNMCDFIVAVPHPAGGDARYLELEVKASSSKPLSARQRDKLAAVREINGYAWRVDANTIEEFKTDLAHLVGRTYDAIAGEVRLRRESSSAAAGKRVHRRLVARRAQDG